MKQKLESDNLSEMNLDNNENEKYVSTTMARALIRIAFDKVNSTTITCKSTIPYTKYKLQNNFNLVRVNRVSYQTNQ